MRVLDVFILLLLLLSWRRYGLVNGRHKRSDPGSFGRDKFRVSWIEHEELRPPIRHYRILQSRNGGFSGPSHGSMDGNNNINYPLFNGATFGKTIRHSSRFLDRLSSSSTNLTMSEFMWNLRGFDRSRRRRSSSANLNLDTKRFNGTWPLKKVAEIDGQIFLGGLMMVHEREDSIMCGPIMPQGGIQALETMLYTVDTINTKPGFLPFKLGVHILDDCDKDTYGLEQAVDFIKGVLNPNGCELHLLSSSGNLVRSAIVKMVGLIRGLGQGDYCSLARDTHRDTETYIW
ncbi:unnamed protein product [Allacma fusca]|uniref:Receptor ligand binding region domain-containing protein n=1 Tax=Allacma fusca TaxID=39272 RepID=A0A8J2NIZ9_9HEXA|nr:unnamed protein product [Allacma fusca]